MEEFWILLVHSNIPEVRLRQIDTGRSRLHAHEVEAGHVVKGPSRSHDSRVSSLAIIFHTCLTPALQMYLPDPCVASLSQQTDAPCLNAKTVLMVGCIMSVR